MTRKTNKKFLSLILSTMLIVAMAFSMTACSDKHTDNSQAGTDVSVNTQVETNADVTVMGEGATVFSFVVVEKDGNETAFEIHTDKTTVGEALLDVELIEGEESEYGLYVKTVNGITADYDVDGTYWAFYINGEMAMSGVDTTDIVEGDIYSFKVE